MTKHSLQYILKDLQNYKRPKQSLMYYYVNQRLNKSLEAYDYSLSISYSFLKDKNQYKGVIKKIL